MLAMLATFATRRTPFAVIAVAASLMAAGTVSAQQKSTDRDFSWDGKITNGRWLYVRNLNGSIRVEKATGDRAEVTAVKRWRRGNPEDVRIETRRLGGDDGDVIICAFWTDNASCDEEGYRSKGDNNWHGHDNDTSVEFAVKLPPGVRLGVSTVNGGLSVSGATSEVRASTVACPSCVSGRSAEVTSPGPRSSSSASAIKRCVTESSAMSGRHLLPRVEAVNEEQRRRSPPLRARGPRDRPRARSL